MLGEESGAGFGPYSGAGEAISLRDGSRSRTLLKGIGLKKTWPALPDPPHARSDSKRAIRRGAPTSIPSDQRKRATTRCRSESRHAPIGRHVCLRERQGAVRDPAAKLHSGGRQVELA